MSAKVHDPITPGEILLTEFLEPLGISQYRLAQATRLPQTRISEIVHGRRRITPDTGLRLSRALGLSERYWINMQTDYDIETEHDLHEEDLRQVAATEHQLRMPLLAYACAHSQAVFRPQQARPQAGTR
jgi:addiction module HigA family antidote